MKNLPLTLNGLLNYSVKNYGSNKAFGYVNEDYTTYHELGKKVASIQAFLEDSGIKKYDKVAILSVNMPNWPLVYLAITSMGAIAVPILPDFTPEEIQNVISHSEANMLFVSDNLKHKIKDLSSDTLECIINIETFRPVSSTGNCALFSSPSGKTGNYTVDEDDLAAIIYTSGTTGKSKGVMLSHKNICSNVIDCKIMQDVNHTDRFLSLLPLSHTFENTVGMLVPFASGASVSYLRKPPSATVLLPAMQEVKPTMMVSVPLIIEKIFYNKVKPALTAGKLLSFAYRLSLLRKILHRKAGKSLAETFGGNIRFFGIGGAKLNFEVERFLKEAKFPYAIGYGLTETSPVLAGMTSGRLVLQSTGAPVHSVQIKINNPDPVTGEGEIWAKGPTIMKGYYKEPELTSEVISKEGWFRTGDLGILSKKRNFLFIKGRLKNVIVGSSGENIYPEEIESLINNFKHVAESLVVHQKGKLVALVHINREELENKYRYLKEEMTRVVEEKIDEILSELQVEINARINKFSKIQMVVLQPVPFQRTATQKIKRYLYS